jgi:hypothetical protein
MNITSPSATFPYPKTRELDYPVNLNLLDIEPPHFRCNELVSIRLIQCLLSLNLNFVVSFSRKFSHFSV